MTDLPLEPLILTAVFLAAVLLVLAVGAALAPRRGLERRLSGGSRLAPRPPVPTLRAALAGPDRTSTTARRLAAAGFSSPRAAALFHLARLATAGVGATGFLAAATLFGLAMTPDQKAALTVCLAAVGAILPSMWIDRRAAHRLRAMREGFPDSLDLLQVCVEAGLGLDAAMARVGDEIGAAHPLLAQQYRLMTQELRAGRARDAALRTLADRIGLDEAKSLAAMLIQSEALGSSISAALRAYAEDMRSRRMLAAEEKAQQLGVKLSMPLILFILPALIVVIIVPAAQKMARLFWPLMTNFH